MGEVLPHTSQHGIAETRSRHHRPIATTTAWSIAGSRALRGRDDRNYQGHAELESGRARRPPG